MRVSSSFFKKYVFYIIYLFKLIYFFPPERVNFYHWKGQSFNLSPVKIIEIASICEPKLTEILNLNRGIKISLMATHWHIKDLGWAYIGPNIADLKKKNAYTGNGENTPELNQRIANMDNRRLEVQNYSIKNCIFDLKIILIW